MRKVFARRPLLLTLMLFTLFAATAARASDDDAQEAAKLYERGMAHYRLEEYPEAIAKWQSAFRIKPVAEFLYNIAQAYRMQHQAERALSFYNKYLFASPNARNRAEVQKHIVQLTQAIQQANRAETAPPTSPRTSQPVGGKDAPAEAAPSLDIPPPAAAAVEVPVAPTIDTVTAPPPASDKPIYKKGWFWGVLVGSAVVVAAVAVGVTLGTESSGRKTLPGLSF